MTADERPPAKSLNLTLEPDDYLCNWLFPDGQGGTVKVHGALTLARAKAQLGGTAFGTEVPKSARATPDGSVVYGFPQRATYPVLRAEFFCAGMARVSLARSAPTRNARTVQLVTKAW